MNIFSSDFNLERIKTYIKNDIPILVNLYEEPHKIQGLGHSYIVEAFNDESKQIRLVDQNKKEDKKKLILKYEEFKEKWKNGPVSELIAVKKRDF